MKAKVLLLGCLLAAPAMAAPETYVSDPPHTMASFEIGHLGFSWVRGRFNKTSATITLDRAEQRGSIEATIDAASVDTANDRRDKIVRSEDYLDVEKFAAITFRSNNLRFKDDNLVGADGELTMLGVTHPVNLEITSFKCGPHPVNKRAQEAIDRAMRAMFGHEGAFHDDAVAAGGLQAEYVPVVHDLIIAPGQQERAHLRCPASLFRWNQAA